MFQKKEIIKTTTKRKNNMDNNNNTMMIMNNRKSVLFQNISSTNHCIIAAREVKFTSTMPSSSILFPAVLQDFTSAPAESDAISN